MVIALLVRRLNDLPTLNAHSENISNLKSFINFLSVYNWLIVRSFLLHYIEYIFFIRLKGTYEN